MLKSVFYWFFSKNLVWLKLKQSKWAQRWSLGISKEVFTLDLFFLHEVKGRRLLRKAGYFIIIVENIQLSSQMGLGIDYNKFPVFLLVSGVLLECEEPLVGPATKVGKTGKVDPKMSCFCFSLWKKTGSVTELGCEYPHLGNAVVL